MLTHAHEDHIGAVPYLLRERPDIPLVGTRFTLALLRRSCASTASSRNASRSSRATGHGSGRSTASSSRSTTRSPTRWPWPSAPPAGLVLHTGDFKMDQLPLDGRLTDLGGFARLGDEGIDLLLSTRPTPRSPASSRRERDIGPVLDRFIATATRRVIVACFASHVHRVQQVLDAAEQHGRHVAFVGRSMVRNMGVAPDLGLLRIPPGSSGRHEAGRQPAGEPVVLVSTGSQGEPLSALSRMANREHHQIRIESERHRGPRVVADPGQRERRLPRHQRAVPLGARGGAQGRREGARLGPRAGR